MHFTIFHHTPPFIYDGIVIYGASGTNGVNQIRNEWNTVGTFPGPSPWAKRFVYSYPIVSGAPILWNNYARIQGAGITSFGAAYGSGFFDGESGYIGIKFLLPDPSDPLANTHFGWIEYEGENNLAAGTIKGWVFDDTPDQWVHAGEVPEPATLSLGLLALGAVGVMRMRQRNQKEKG